MSEYRSKKWSLHRQPRELLGQGDCEYSIWLDNQIVVMADPAFDSLHALEVMVCAFNLLEDIAAGEFGDFKDARNEARAVLSQAKP